MILELTHHHQRPKSLKLNFRLSLPLLRDHLSRNLLLLIFMFQLFDSLEKIANFLGHSAIFLLFNIFQMPLIDELNMV
jgi:hypothetical protein